MFDIGGGELMLILIVVVVLFGPKKLPELMQGLGKGIREFKKAQRDFTEHINTAFEEEQRRDYRRKNSGDDRSPGNTIPRNSQSSGPQAPDSPDAGSSDTDSSAPDADERHDQLAGGGMDEQLAGEAQPGEENPSEAPRGDIPFPTAPPEGAVPRGKPGVDTPPTDLPPSSSEPEKEKGNEDNHTHDT
jgi:sec-independent protein translocase protein TatA